MVHPSSVIRGGGQRDRKAVKTKCYAEVRGLIESKDGFPQKSFPTHLILYNIDIALTPGIIIIEVGGSGGSGGSVVH